MPKQSTTTKKHDAPKTVARGVDGMDVASTTHDQADHRTRAYPHDYGVDSTLDTLRGIEAQANKNPDDASGENLVGNVARITEILRLYPGFPTATPAGIALTFALKQIDAVLWRLAQNPHSDIGSADARLQVMHTGCTVLYCKGSNDVVMFTPTHAYVIEARNQDPPTHTTVTKASQKDRSCKHNRLP